MLELDQDKYNHAPNPVKLTRRGKIVAGTMAVAASVALIVSAAESKAQQPHVSAGHVAFTPDMSTNLHGNLRITAGPGSSPESEADDYAYSPDKREALKEALITQERTVTHDGITQKVFDVGQGLNLPLADVQQVPVSKGDTPVQP